MNRGNYNRHQGRREKDERRSERRPRKEGRGETDKKRIIRKQQKRKRKIHEERGEGEQG